MSKCVSLATLVFVENSYHTLSTVFIVPWTSVSHCIIKWMKQPTDVHSSSWFCRWLYLVWVINPVATAFVMLFLITVPSEFYEKFCSYLILFDLLHIIFIITEYFSTELVVEHGICEDRVLKWRLFRKWQFYVDLLSLIIPLLTNNYIRYKNYGLLRLLRLRLLYDFHQQFCKEFQSTVAPMLLKFIIVFYLLHCMTCGWIYIACRDPEFPLQYQSLPEYINLTVDYTEWTTPEKRKGGCARLTKNYLRDKMDFGFLVPIHWAVDYLVAMLYIIIIYSHTETDVVVAVNLKQIYYKLLISCIIYIIEIWLLSVAISATYTKCRKLYSYDYDVNNLIRYLQHTGLSPTLLKSVKEYTKQLWKKQKGNWLPELAQQAPQCLREDLFSALYLHHLLSTPLFRDLPLYFNRQLVTKLQRIVIFPGKFIVREGDIFSFACFIHEGEVEKWYTDSNGEKKLHSVLNTNGYFGLIQSLYPNTPYQFSYFSRTVVDILYLRYKDWLYLISSYPDIKTSLYDAANAYKRLGS